MSKASVKHAIVTLLISAVIVVSLYAVMIYGIVKLVKWAWL